jgi:hypothetical protein
MTPCIQAILLDRAEGGAGQNRQLLPASDGLAAAVEGNDLAREMAGAFGGMVRMYREHGKLTAEEAVRLAERTSPACLDRILNAPPDAVSWLDLDALARQDEDKVLRCWEDIKQAARDELRSGHRAARAVEDGGGTWERARFLAVRAELSEAHRPRDAGEEGPVLRDDAAERVGGAGSGGGEGGAAAPAILTHARGATGPAAAPSARRHVPCGSGEYRPNSGQRIAPGEGYAGYPLGI